MTYALITGASKGIGKAMAYNLAEKKINLLLIARSSDLLSEIGDDLNKKYGIETKYLSVDLAEENAAEIIFDWVNKNNSIIHILINNAGYGLSGKFQKYSANEYADMLNVNITTLVKLTSLFLPMLRQQPKSYILNIASTAAYQAVPYLSCYAASKSFVVSFSRALHYELRKTKVSVTCVSPGGTKTDFEVRADISAQARKTGKKLNMEAEDVATIAIKAMFRNKREKITGGINSLGAFLVWLLPKRLAEKVAADLYK